MDGRSSRSGRGEKGEKERKKDREIKRDGWEGGGDEGVCDLNRE